MKVYVGIYEHRHGTDVCVYQSLESAEKARQAVAAEWWDSEIGEVKPSNPEALADAYFEKMGMDSRPEYFSIEACEVLP